MNKTTEQVFFRYVKATLDEDRRRRRYRRAAQVFAIAAVWLSGVVAGLVVGGVR